MMGYVTAEKAELKMIEYEIYGGYYCGVCKYIGKEYGQLPRMVLSYDAAFLALLLGSISAEADIPRSEHCILHHVKKKTVIHNKAVEYAGDVMLILAWHKVIDDASDEGKVYAKAILKTMKRLYRKLRKRKPVLCKSMEENLKALGKLEEEKCSNLDMVAEAFSKIMEDIFVNNTFIKGELQKNVLSRMGYHLGKWIYVIDAYDDIEQDITSGVYNPLVYRYEYDDETETPEGFKDRIRESCSRNLLIYLEELGKASDLLDIKKNKGIIENIIYLGLLRRTEKILAKGETKDE